MPFIDLSPVGAVHTALGMLALLVGLAVLSQPKGTLTHRRWGYTYATALLLVNVTAFGLYRLLGHFGPFHALALVSLITLAVGFIPALLRRPPQAWLPLHAFTMCWSYVGLVAAFLSEVAVRVLHVGVTLAGVAGAVIAMTVGGAMIHTHVGRLIRAQGRTPGRA